MPDGRREKSITLPGKLNVSGIAIGEDRGSPLTLILGEIAGQPTERIADQNGAAQTHDRGIVVLDSTSLQPGMWAQPTWVAEADGRVFGGNTYNLGSMTAKPVRLASGRNGQFILLTQLFITIGQKSSIVARNPDENTGGGIAIDAATPPRGSLSGMIFTDAGGNVFTGGVMESRVNMEGNVLSVSPCGRYRLVRKNPTHGEGWVIEVRTIENNRPLFRTGRFVLARPPFEHGGEISRFRVSVVAPSGPLVIRSGDGKCIQIVQLDIPSLAQQILPSGFHITSQAAPCVMAGEKMDYQIQTNNPGAVAGFKLRTETEGATLSSGGLLHFDAPKQVATPTKVNFSIEIAGKDGNALLHEFPVFVVPFPKDAPAPKPPQPALPPI